MEASSGLSFEDLIQNKVTRFRMREWDDKVGYYKVMWVDEAKQLYGPWFQYYDREMQDLLKMKTPQLVNFTFFVGSGSEKIYEPFEGERDIEDLD